MPPKNLAKYNLLCDLGPRKNGVSWQYCHRMLCWYFCVGSCPHIVAEHELFGLDTLIHNIHVQKQSFINQPTALPHITELWTALRPR